MNVYTFQDLMSYGKPYADLMQSLQADRLVPILGSGFTVGLPTKAGSVPNADALKEKLSRMLCTFGNYSEADRKSIEAKDLSTVSDYFVEATKPGCELSIEAAKKDFLSYMENYYSGVHDIPSNQREFLQCGWPYLYTLNYDTAVESVLADYEVVVPYRQLNTKWLKDKKCVIKLHGDVHTLLQTGDLRYCVLSKKQYLDTITDQENHNLMSWLQDDCSSKDLLFIGCSLTNEYDFLFADSGRGSKLSDDSSRKSYYVYYDNSPGEDISIDTTMKLRSYDIENILRITPDEFGEFYGFLKTMCDETKKLTDLDKFDKYSDYTFSTLSPSNENGNISYIFDNSSLGINSPERRIVLPSFFIQRDAEHDILTYLERETSICILNGNRFSGKTYILLGLLKSLQAQRKKAYLITGIGLSDKMLQRIKRKNNCIFLFDSGTLTNHQLREAFYDQVGEMKKQRLQIVYVVDRSDRNFVKVFGRIGDLDSEYIYSCPVETCMSTQELNDFNRGMKDLTLTERKSTETFLDFAIRVDDESLKEHPSILPDTNILSPERPEMVECLIVLAVCSSFDNNLANMLDIRDELTDLCAHVERAVQKDYLSILETSWGTHSGVKFVSNSTYWLYRCLSDFSKTTSHYETIAQAIKNIIERYVREYTRADGSLDYDIFQQIQPYYYLDTLQKMFFCNAPSKGSLELPEMIYTRLKGILGNDYQFLHQTAKCKLRLSRRCKHQEARLDVLDQAKRILDRGYDLAEKSVGPNIEYTLAHMNVTRALILTNYLRYCNLMPEATTWHLHTAVNYYHYIYVEKSEYVGAINSNLESDEWSDIKWFTDCFLNSGNPLRMALTDRNDRRQVVEIVRAYYNRPITIDWGDSASFEAH